MKTNIRTFMLDDLPKLLVEKVDERMSNWEERVRHTSEKIEQDWSWNSLALDELSRIYAIISSYYEAIESWITKEQFEEIFCKD